MWSGLLLFGDISSGTDKARMSKQPVSLSFSTKLTSGRRLGWAGLQLWQSGCLFGVTILWKCCGQTAEKINTFKWDIRVKTSAFIWRNISFHLQWTNGKSSKLEETWMKTTLWDEPDEWQSRYVARGGEGVQEEHPVDIVPSPGGRRMEGIHFWIVWPRTYTPAYTVTHRDAKQVWTTL